VDELTTDRRILFFFLFDLSVWPSDVYHTEPAGSELKTDRRILFFLIYLSGRQRVPFQLPISSCQSDFFADFFPPNY
jgi:hypothetical protein